jgi:hypothetical protein
MDHDCGAAAFVNSSNFTFYVDGLLGFSYRKLFS